MKEAKNKNEYLKMKKISKIERSPEINNLSIFFFFKESSNSVIVLMSYGNLHLSAFLQPLVGKSPLLTFTWRTYTCSSQLHP